MRIGLICGCFDMFHIGHLNILEKCKNDCDYLIVGICDDSYIINHKHKNPIISQDHRARIVQALKCVDETIIVSYDDCNNKLPIIKNKNITVLYDGSDWTNNPRYDLYRKEGIELKFFPYTDGISSSILREKL